MMILITGSGGRVGRSLEAALQRRFSDRVVAATREELDLKDSARLAMEMERLDPQPTVTVNCAALTDPRLAESVTGEYQEVNRTGVASLARACRELGCRLIHLSTVDVFSGSSPAPYREEEAGDAATQYGKIRHLGELAAAEENPDHLILRMSMLCGDFEAGDPLLAILQALKTGEPLTWHDRRVTPLWMEDLSSALHTILRTDWKGVLHLGNGGPCLLSEIVDEMAQLLGSPRVPELIG
ncbi:MAG: sugar nucleotide-binding protein, partial [Acidobacteria bacterium]|nr:sugar nucleotide-binding protein [Acidobacteriota bacterium]